MTFSKATAQIDGVRSVHKTGTIVPFPRAYAGNWSNAYGLALKRCFDLLFACVALVITAPALLVALIAIPIQSRGWPLFVQRRVGKNGRFFNILKLRTMYVGSDSYDFKTASGDSRLTAVGKILRKTNIDELPQLINVLIGDMSLIGPRPLSADETNYIADALNLDSDHPGFIPKMRPGLVGLEQVNRVRDLTYRDRFAYNEEYESCWTLSNDARIFLRGLLVCKDVCMISLLGALLVGILFLISFA